MVIKKAAPKAARVKGKKREVKSKAVKAGSVVKRPKAGTHKRTIKANTGKGASRTKNDLGLEKMGEVTHYFPKVKAAAVKILKDGLKLGDNIYIKGHSTDFKEKINSIQLDRIPMPEGKKGQEIGLYVKSRVRIGDSVYRI